jgi:L-ascorbate metabolism protein UlaG (beta-lactamase superfamily)
MKIIYYGHSCFAAEINGKHLLFDPFITQNPLAKAETLVRGQSVNLAGSGAKTLEQLLKVGLPRAPSFVS